MNASPAEILKQDRATLYSGPVWIWDDPTQRYVRVTDSFPANTGFWVYGATGQAEVTDGIAGFRAAGNTLPLRAGWNLIGVSRDIDVPDGVIAYEHSGGQYVRATHFAVGRGYWIFTRDAGTLELIGR